MHIDVRDGGVFVGGDAWVEPLAGSADVTIAPFDPRVTSGVALAHHVSLSVRVRGSLPDVRHLEALLPEGVNVGGAVDVPRFELNVKDGVLRAGTHVEASAPRATVTARQHGISGALNFEAAIASAVDGHERLTFHVEGTDWRAMSAGVPIGSAKRVLVAGDAGELDLARPFADLHGVADVVDADLPEAAALGVYLGQPPAFVLSSGHLRGDAHLEAWGANKVATARATVRADGVDLEVAGVNVRGTFDGEASARSFRWDECLVEGVRIDLRARVALRDGSLSLAADVTGSASGSRWYPKSGVIESPEARVTVTGVRGSLHGPGRDEFAAERIEVGARATRWNAALPTGRGVEMRLSVRNAEVPDARALQRLLPDRGAWVAESGTARGSADLRISSEGRVGGSLQVRLLHAGVRFHGTRLRGDLRAVARLASSNGAPGIVDLSGSAVTLTDVQAVGASTETSNWGGQATLRHASLRWAPTPLLDGELVLDARDGNPFLAILLGKDLPKVFAGLFAMPRLTGSARLTAASQRLALRDLVLGGGDLAVRGFYASQGNIARGPSWSTRARCRSGWT